MKLHTMKLRREPFEKIASGRKTVELRLYDEKRQQIEVGDHIRFICDGDVLQTEVKALHRFDSFGELYAALRLCMEVYGAPEDMETYYTPEEQARYGVIGIEIEVL